MAKKKKNDEEPTLASVAGKMDEKLYARLQKLEPHESVFKGQGKNKTLCFQVDGVDDAMLLRTGIGASYGIAVSSRGQGETYMTTSSYENDPTVAQLCTMLSHPHIHRLLGRAPGSARDD